MKKLMLAATIVCAAVMAQAAQIAWKTNNKQLCDVDGNPITALPTGQSLALVVMDSATGWATAKDLTDKTTFTISTVTSASVKGRVTGTTLFTYNGDGVEGTDISNGQYLALMFKDGTGLHQLKYVDGDGLVDATWKVSGLLNSGTSIPSSTASIGMAGNFYAAAAVPEPTSAMLLLLGVAGLALRRRRA